MSIKKYANVQIILEELISTYKLGGYPGLANHLGIKYQTLMGWKKRDSIGDYAPFLDKCPGIRLKCLQTGEGDLFEQRPDGSHPMSVNETPPEYFSSPDKYYLWSLINRMTDEEAEEFVRVIVARKKDRGPT